MSFLEGCAKAAQLDLAKAWWRSMEEDWDIQVERKHYDALISACRNDFKEAQRWFKRLLEDGFVPEVHAAIICNQPAFN
eukprot:g16186.t1